MATRLSSRVFVSHSSANAATAMRVGTALQAAGIDAWLDSSDIRLGMLLRNELHAEIQKSRGIVLLWSVPASKSRWVAAEILTAFHMDRFIVACVLDDAPLPQFLGNSVYLDLRKNEAVALDQLARSAKNLPKHANPIPPRIGSESAELKRAIDTLPAKQNRVTAPLLYRELKTATEEQRALDPVMKLAEERWPHELTILSLGGYHRKNGYMVKHWDAIQAGRPPKDPLLHEGERLFFDALFVDPLDVSALNGLGSILIFELELDVAEFFVRRAIALNMSLGLPYDAAVHDLNLIEWLRTLHSRPSKGIS